VTAQEASLAHQDALLAALRGRTTPAAAATVPRRPAGTPPPLSYAQERMWLINQFDGAGDRYTIPISYRLTGDVDREALRAALGDVFGRHESLRTVFPVTDGVPHAVVRELSTSDIPFRVVGIGGADGVAADDLDASLAAAELSTFDLTVDLPLRAWLFPLATPDAGRCDEHILMLLLHHIAGDAASVPPLIADLAQAYAARLAGRAPDWPPLAFQYGDFASWQRSALGDSGPSTVYARQLDFWVSTLAGLPEELAIPGARHRPQVRDYGGDETVFELDPALHGRLRALARDGGATLFMVLQAGLAALLNRLGAGTDIAIGTPITRRTGRGYADQVGLYLNTLVLRTDTAGDPSFTELIGRVRAADLDAYDNADVPFERVVERLNPPRSTARHPLFQVMMALSHDPPGVAELPGVTMRLEPPRSRVARFDLTVQYQFSRAGKGGPGAIEGAITYPRDLFDRPAADALAQRLLRLLDAAAAQPARPIGEIELLSAAERRAILVRWSRGGPERPARPVHQVVADWAVRTPDAPAVIWGDQTVSYRELTASAHRLARRLRAAGVAPEVPVGICLERGPELVVAVLGVLGAGGTYVPLDPGYPDQRLSYMVADAGVEVLVAPDGIRERLAAGSRAVVIDPLGAGEPDATELTASPVDPADLAYIMYTSGSTGRPKGVMVTHAGLAAVVAASVAAFGVGPGRRVLQHASIGFDNSAWEMFMALTAGATLCLCPATDAWSGPALGALIERQRVDFAVLTPTVLGLVDPARCAGLRTLLVGGEPLPAALAARWSPGRDLFNTYGPTEASIHVSLARIEAGPDRPVPPIGRPNRGVTAYVLDRRLRPVPAGSIGELFVGGCGVARGYAGRAGQTAECFLPDPYAESSGARMYRSGDLVRWTPDGMLEFVGRRDDQIKIRGVRIEPAEVESALAASAAVAEALVVVREDRLGEQQLVAYLVPAEPAAALDVEQLRRLIRAGLPDAMVPSAFVTLDRLPLTGNGKVDRSALPAPAPPAIGHDAPRTPQEELLCRLFAEVLRLPAVGAEDSFFDLGGTSLLLAQLVSRIHEVLGIELSLRALFETATPAALANRMGGDRGGSGALDVLLALRRGTGPPLFCVHPLAGLSWCYSGLLQYLPREMPVFGVQARGLARPAALPTTLRAMARDYLAAIRTVAPTGPYRLLGWSMGGAVAHAIATDLQRQGETVDLLVMLDAYPQGRATPPAPAGEAEILRWALASLGIAVDDVGDTAVSRQRVLAAARRSGSALGSLDPPTISALLGVVMNNERLMRAPQLDRFHGDVLYFEAARHGGTAGEPAADLWRPYVTGQVVRTTVDCPHERMTSSAALATIGPLLVERLAGLAARLTAARRGPTYGEKR